MIEPARRAKHLLAQGVSPGKGACNIGLARPEPSRGERDNAPQLHIALTDKHSSVPSVSSVVKKLPVV